MGQYYIPTKINEKGLPEEWVYAHDYGNGLKLMEHSYIGNNFVQAVESMLIPVGGWYQDRIVWTGDYADNIKGKKGNVYSYCGENLKINPAPLENSDEYRYILNFDKKEFVDKERCAEFDAGWKIHPLPLLTADGNGRGGGDYHGGSDLVGYWAGDRIGLDKVIPEGFVELVTDFIER